MERAFKIGCSVVFFDSHRQPHEALVTNWFHGGPDGQTVAELQAKHDERVAAGVPYAVAAKVSMPACNVVWVAKDKEKSDPYGRQLERQTSCSYGWNQGMTPFIGMCWCWPDEIEEATELAAKAYAEAVAK